MSADLLFAWPLDTAHPANLLLGRPAAPVQDATGYLDITLPADAVMFEGLLQYDNAVQRSDVIGAGCGWQAARPVAPAQLTAPYATTTSVPAARALPWRVASRMSAAARSPWSSGVPMRTSARAPWSVAARLAPRRTSSAWQPAIPVPARLAAPWQPATSVGSHRLAGWQVAYIIRPLATRLPWGAGVPLRLALRTSAGPAEPIATVVARLPWGSTEPLPPGRTPVIVIPPPEPWRCYTPPAGSAAHLLFDERLTAGADLLFTCGRGTPSGAIIIPTLKVYIVINSASLTRVSNNLPIPVTGQLRIAIDADSAHWTWSTTVPLRALADLEPNAPGELVELEAVINGTAWRLLVESKREAERFGQASLQIGGRGIAAEIADPAYPVISHDNIAGALMAQQLAAAALMLNGVPIGWGLDWQSPDWLVPAGAWVHSGTPLQAVARIAEAAGAYVQPSASARTLRVMPRYPVAPWEWGSATPAVVLPADAVLERGAEHIARADYNAVYVSGEEGGILARVKRAGSAGDRAAQMIVDRLVTHADAARGRGLAVLGNTGAQQLLTLETGILPASGVIHVGTLMDWTRGSDTRRGLVRSLAVTASVPSGASRDPLIVRQTLGVETHG